MYKIQYSTQFEKSLKKIPKQIAQLLNRKQAIFSLNPFDKLLRTHRLQGELHEYFSFSVNYEYRVLFRIEDKKIILLLDIGTHEIYKK